MFPGVMAASNAWFAQTASEDYPILLSAESGSFNTASTTHNIPLGTYNVGDLLFVFIAGRTDTGTAPTVPTGWLGFLNYPNTTPAPDGRKGYLYKIMDGTEGSSLAVTLAASQAITYGVLRFKAGTYEADLNYMFQLNLATSTAVSSTIPSNYYLFFGTATMIREVSVFGLQSVTTYPEPTGVTREAAGTGVSTTVAKTYMNVKENITPPTKDYVAPSWVYSASASNYELGFALRGSRALGYPDPRVIRSWLFSTAGVTTTMVAPFQYAKVGDMIIAASRAETGALSSLTGFTQFYSSGSVQFLYKVLTESDINSDVIAAYGSSGNHAGMFLRVRAGTFEVGAIPEVASSNSGSSTSVTVPTAELSAGYIGKRNLGFVFESHVFGASQIFMHSQTQYPLGPFQVTAASSNAVGATGVYGVFDGVSAPGETATLTAAASWVAQLVVLKGLPIP